MGGVSDRMALHQDKTGGDSAGAAPRKPSKLGQRPEHHETDAKVPTAKPVPNRPGFVFHPVNGEIVDVRGIPAGHMVQQSGATFFIPKMGYVITAEDYHKAVWKNFGAGLSGESSGESEGVLTWSPSGADLVLQTEREADVTVVSCKALHWKTQWDDGTPFELGETGEEFPAIGQ